jgi:hypothetical protein
MPKIIHPHVAIDGVLGPAGSLPAHFHESDPVHGMVFQCPRSFGFDKPICGHVYSISWADLDALNEDRLNTEYANEMVHLPPCPACGGQTIFGNNDIEYGQDLPEHHSMRVIREHVAMRPAFASLKTWPASIIDPKFPGRDFSHLPRKDRPSHHKVVDVAAEAALRDRPE